MNSTLFTPTTKPLLEQIGSASYSQIAICLIVCFWATTLISAKAAPRVPGAQIAGRKVWWEPPFILQFRFFFDAVNVISDGYHKFKDEPFVIRRYDTDVTLLPIKHLEEFRSFPKNKLSRTRSLLKLLVAEWTGIEFLFRSDLINRALTSRLTPHLDTYLIATQDELSLVWDTIMPQTQDWAKVDIQHCIRYLIASTSARVFVGQPACRDPQWLRTSVGYAEDAMLNSYVLRLFPKWTYPVVGYCIPFRWRLMRHYKVAENMVREVLQGRTAATDNGDEIQDTLLNWMIDKGTKQETEVHEMAARQFVNTYGWAQESNGISSTQWTSKLEKLDSFIVETQRLDPVTLVGPMRLALVDVHLNDGTRIPAGADVAVPSYHYANDPSVTPDPETFDPLRSYRKRYANDGVDLDKFMAGQTNATQLTFGHGGQACPGRQYAVNQMKLMLSRILMEYDLSWPEGVSSARNFFINELNVVDPWAKIMMKKRQTGG